MKKLQIFLGIILLLGIFLPALSLVSAQLPTPGSGLNAPVPKPAGLPGDPSNQGNRASQVISTYITIALAVVGILAVAFIIYGGFRYITSAGNEESAKAGKDAIRNGIIGLIIIILSYVIITVIINALARGTV